MPLMGVRKLGDHQSLTRFRRNMERGIHRVKLMSLKEASAKMQVWTKETLQNGVQSWDKLHPVTVEAKGSDQPLVDSGQLVEGINIYQVAQYKFEVGYKEGDTRSDGRAHDLVAATMQEGATIPVTDGIRAYFASLGYPLRATTDVLYIPPRPFLEPTLEGHLDDLGKLAAKILMDLVDFLTG